MNTATHAPGWDSKVRARVVRIYGSLRSFAEMNGIDISDIPENGRRNAMKVWSRIVRHFGSTANVESELAIH